MIPWLFGCDSSYDSADPKERARAVEQMGEYDQYDFKNIAKTDSDRQVRAAALARIKELGDLAEVASAAESAEASAQALGHIDGPKALIRVVTNSRWPSVRLAALAKIDDQEELASVVHRGRSVSAGPDGSPSMAERALARIDDSAVLVELVKTVGDRETALAVLQRIEDSALLYSLAEAQIPDELRQAATSKIDDPELLLRLLAESKSAPIRLRAVQYIQDQERLKQICLTNLDWRVRALATQRLEDQSTLFALANDDESWPVRRTALARLEGSDQRMKILRASDDLDQARFALDAWNDPALLSSLVKEADFWGVRKLCAERISDAAVLAERAIHDTHFAVRLAAIGRIENQEYLELVVKESALEDVRVALALRLTDQDWLRFLAVNDARGEAARAAIERIEDVRALVPIANEAKLPEARLQAKVRLAPLLPGDDPVLLAWAMDRSSEELAKAAVSSMTDNEALRRVARSAPEYEVQQIAYGRITDRSALWQLMQSGHFSTERAASERWVELTPVEELPRALSVGANGYALEYAVPKTEDQAFLVRIVRERPKTKAAELAVGKLERVEDLEELRIGNYPNKIQRAAMVRLGQVAIPEAAEALFENLSEYELRNFIEGCSDSKLLAFIAMHSKESRTATEAIAQMSDSAVLSDLARAAPAEFVRGRAVERQNRLMAAEIENITKVETLEDVLTFQGDSPPFIHFVERRNPTLQHLAQARLLQLQPELLAEVRGQRYLFELSKRIEDLPEWAQTVLFRLDHALVIQWRHRTWNHKTQLVSVAATDDQGLLVSMAAAESVNDDLRVAALSKITNDSTLARLAVRDSSFAVRSAAFEALHDVSSLRQSTPGTPREQFERASLSLDLRDRLLAAFLSPDSTLLLGLAVDEPSATARMRALGVIAEDSFLFERVRQDSSSSVRQYALRRIQDPSLLAVIAIHSDTQETRRLARERLQEYEDPQSELLSYFAERVPISLQESVKQIRESEDTRNLIEIAIGGRYDVLRMAAVRRLSAPARLAQVATRSTDRSVIKEALQRIHDSGLLESIADKAALPTTRIAASVKSGRTTWSPLFSKATERGAQPGELGNLLAAVQLLPVDEAVKREVTLACLEYIRRGDESRIPELSDLLEDYGGRALAEDYYNCGQPDLQRAAQAWASARGLGFSQEGGSSRASWGSRR